MESVQRHRRGSLVPRRGNEWIGDSGWETWHLVTPGHCSTGEHPWEHAEGVAEDLADELEQQLARKRPPGFAPWPWRPE